MLKDEPVGKKTSLAEGRALAELGEQESLSPLDGNSEGLQG